MSNVCGTVASMKKSSNTNKVKADKVKIRHYTAESTTKELIKVSYDLE